jgi:protein-arginine kinase activator protein McsA
MKCEACGQSEAVITYTHIANNQKQSLHLCRTEAIKNLPFDHS